MPRATRGLFVLAACFLARRIGAAQHISIGDALNRAGAHVEQFHKQLAGIVAEETYVQSVYRASAASMDLDRIRSRGIERRLLQDTQVTARVVVEYVLEPTRGFRVPATMEETYSAG